MPFDILNVDLKIKKKFESEKDKLETYINRLDQIESALDVDSLRSRVKDNLNRERDRLNEKIFNIENDTEYNFYIFETSFLIEKYQEILKTPIKISFVGKSKKESKEKKDIMNQYMNIAKKYITLKEEEEKIKKVKNKIVCPNCDNKKNFDVDDDIYTCSECDTLIEIMKNNSSYRDIDRINISTKYKYDRKTHFRDCVNQYQGKQNCTIPLNIYEELEDQFEKHHLLIISTKKEVKFSNITKEHIHMFLKELGHSKHYENINLIHYTFTGIKPINLGNLEGKILDDFDVFADLYDKRFKDLDRKNFINNQGLLYQLLKRHKFTCKQEDFTILKTVDRKLFHDHVCKLLFEELGWNYTPCF